MVTPGTENRRDPTPRLRLSWIVRRPNRVPNLRGRSRRHGATATSTAIAAGSALFAGNSIDPIDLAAPGAAVANPPGNVEYVVPQGQPKSECDGLGVLSRRLRFEAQSDHRESALWEPRG
jgi:hypothetical protein